MDKQEKVAIMGDISHILFVLGECTFIGVAIGALITEHTFISRWLLASSGFVISTLFFGLHMYANRQTRKKSN
jgi:hypothetical protein